jgi:hypothetical protein
MNTVTLAAAVLAVIASPLLAVRVDPAARELMNRARPLTSAEIATVLDASRQALAAKTFRLSAGNGERGMEVMMGAGGWPRRIRSIYGLLGGTVGGTVRGTATAPRTTSWREDFITIVDYTGRPARRCDGSVEDGEMAIEFTFRQSTREWTTTARRRGDRESAGPGPGFMPMFEMLRDEVPLTSDERRRDADGHRSLRAFVAQWTPPADRREPSSPQPQQIIGDPMPNVTGESASSGDRERGPEQQLRTQRLWIDTVSLLPRRWEVFDPDRAGKGGYGFDFVYERLELRLPANVTPPACIG